MNDSSTTPDPNPSGLCMCGCGERTATAPLTDRPRGRVKGKPMRFVHGHNARIRAKSIDYIVDDNGCWVWQRFLNDRGYGQMWDSAARKNRNAYAVYYERKFGPAPDGLELDHLCRNRACVNPDHLEAVLRSENLRRGMATKLTRIQAVEIHAASHAGESASSIARRHGMAKSAVLYLLHGSTWVDVFMEVNNGVHARWPRKGAAK